MVSIVVPVYNEEESLETFYEQLFSVVKALQKPYEIIFLDDGSTDSSFLILKGFEEKNPQVKIYSFRKNQGKSEALTLGFSKASGEYIITLDADLQDMPSEIEKLLNKAEKGFDLVVGWRKNRKDPLKKVISSKFFNLLARIFWGLKLHDYNCGLKVYTKEAAQSLSLYGGLHRFIPLLVYQEGFSVVEVPVVHQIRKFGKSKYGFSKLWKDLPDIFTMLFISRYGERPLHFFGTIGGILFIFGVIISLYLSILHFQGQAIGRRPLLFLGMLLILVGIQIFFTGFLADLMINLSRKNGEQNRQFLLKYSSDK